MEISNNSLWRVIGMAVVIFIVLIIVAIVLIKRKAGGTEGIKTKDNSLYIATDSGEQLLATWKDGTVWYKEREKGYIIGTYSSENVINKEKECIGFVTDEETIWLDRHFLFEQLKTMLSSSMGLNDINLVNFYDWNRKLGERLGSETGSIESKYAEQNKYYYDAPDNDKMGAAAAFLLLIYEGVIENHLHDEFTVAIKFQEYLIRNKYWVGK